ncbi:hypothetical protein DNK47_01745 [Mycoplasma wenyonii]|uniref:Uncharacterized protein n=1 Tax=Mycoplasma wenyonii TaxID=65123 RepID=A0A328PKX9_9MOLU|nr:hypothetical protein [Mycoplasma wenyonii]RAO95054.1 hypothetical protein DNK47_01745 [Mycoplasma wenyonii]
MYLCAKLIGIASAIISTGTVSSVVIPYLKNTQNNWLFNRDFKAHSQDFKELDKTTETRLEKLNSLFDQFSSAKTASEELKKSSLEKIQPLFETIFKTEEEVKKLFDDISNSLLNLVTKNEVLFSTSTKKLEADKQEKLHKELQTKYSSIKDILKQWKDSLSQISCAIEKKDKGDSSGEQCVSKTSEITDFFESVGTLFSAILDKKNGQATTNGVTETDENGIPGGAEKAQKDLEKVKEALLKAIKDFNKQSGVYRVRSTYALSKEKVATMLLVALSVTINSLNKEIEKLTESIQQNQNTSQEKTQTIVQAQQELENSYKDYSLLQKMETLFQWWKENFEEKIMQNKDDKARETDLMRRKRKR